MKKLTILVFAFIVFLFAYGQPAPAAIMPPDPSLGSAWLMVSFSCAVDTATLKERYSNSIQVFGWTNENYAAVDRLEPGKGYFVNYDFDIVPIAVCPEGGDGVTQMTLAQGWNLIGNPLDQAVPFSHFQTADGSSPILKVFSLVGSSFVSLALDQNAQPGVAYWVFVAEPASVEVVSDVPAIDIDYLTMDIPGLSVMPYECRSGDDYYGYGNYSMDTGTKLAIDVTGYAYGQSSYSYGGCVIYDDYSGYNYDYDYYDYGYGYGYGSSKTHDLSKSATYSISDPSVAEIVNGELHALKPGTVTISASFGSITSYSYTINITDEGTPLCLRLSPESGANIPPEGAVSLSVNALFNDGNSRCDTSDLYNDYGYNYNYGYCSANVTDEVQWTLSNPSLLTIAGDTATAGKTMGSLNVSATLDGLTSNSIPIEIKKINWMLVYTTLNAPVLPGCPYQGAYAGCYTTKPGQEHKLTVMAQQDSSMWTYPQNVTAMAKWEVSDTNVAEVDAAGKLEAKSQGVIWIRANVGDARSDKIWLAVNDQSGYEFLITGPAYNSGFKPLKPLQSGSTMELKAVHFKYTPGTGDSSDCSGGYDIDFDGSSSSSCYSDYKVTDVTHSAQWKVSDTTLGSFSQITSSYCSSYYSSYGNTCTKTTAFKGKAPGLADISATYNSLDSNSFTIDVWNFQNLSYCDAGNINKGEWSDAYSNAELETDCNVYSRGEPVTLRYSAYIKDRIYLDNCLDMYVMDDQDNIVCTLREQGCTSEEIGRVSAKTADPVYQYVDTCDMKDKDGNPVAAGTYYAVARFYIMWEPVIRLPFTVVK